MFCQNVARTFYILFFILNIASIVIPILTWTDIIASDVDIGTMALWVLVSGILGFVINYLMFKPAYIIVIMGTMDGAVWNCIGVITILKFPHHLITYLILGTMSFKIVYYVFFINYYIKFHNINEPAIIFTKKKIRVPNNLHETKSTSPIKIIIPKIMTSEV